MDEGCARWDFSARATYLVRAHYLGNSTFDEGFSLPVPLFVGMPGGRP